MREFDTFEIDVIKALVNARKDQTLMGLRVVKYIDEQLACRAIEWTTEGPCSVSLYYEDGKNPEELFLKLCDIILLFKYLEEQGLILLYYSDKVVEENAMYNHKKYKKQLNKYVKIDDEEDLGENKKFKVNADLSILINKYLHCLVHPSYELIQYVDRKYKTTHDIEVAKQQKQTKQSIRIALLSALIALGIGIASLCTTCKSMKLPITINQEQYNGIIECVNANTTPKLVDVHITNDTLDVNIKESIRINTRSHITNMPKP